MRTMMRMMKMKTRTKRMRTRMRMKSPNSFTRLVSVRRMCPTRHPRLRQHHPRKTIPKQQPRQWTMVYLTPEYVAYFSLSLESIVTLIKCSHSNPVASSLSAQRRSGRKSS